MPIIIWNDRLSVGIVTIDAHHKVLVDYINRLFDAERTGQADKELNILLDKLIDYTRYHFSFEENLMKQNDYPGLAAHKSAHDALVAQINDVRTKMEKGQAGLSNHVFHFLKDWLTNHILGEDKKFGSHFARKGFI